jgi:hypothetical protein
MKRLCPACQDHYDPAWVRPPAPGEPGDNARVTASLVYCRVCGFFHAPAKVVSAPKPAGPVQGLLL